MILVLTVNKFQADFPLEDEQRAGFDFLVFVY